MSCQMAQPFSTTTCAKLKRPATPQARESGSAIGRSGRISRGDAGDNSEKVGSSLSCSGAPILSRH